MPRARLGKGSWQLEGDALAALRAKITAGRPTLGEVYGPPLYGIKTGLNAAFVIGRETRDALVARDPKSADLLKPFLRGENIKRWRVESEDLFLINTPKGKVDIETYPAIRDWLSPFREQLEKRATQQEWWELQQAQLAYQDRLGAPKISYPHFQNSRMFTAETSGAFSNDKSYFIPCTDGALLAYLNSSLSWFFLTSISPAVRNGWHELRVQYVTLTPIPRWGVDSGTLLATTALQASTAAETRTEIYRAFCRRILDLSPAAHLKIPSRLAAWHGLSFAKFREEVRKAFGTEIPLKERGDWEAYLAENAAEVNALTARITAAEREIDAIVYRLFDLTPEEIALLETSIAGQH